MLNIPKDMVSGAIHQTVNYGPIEIVKYFNFSKVLIEFKDTKFKTTTRSDSIRNGRIKDPKKPILYGRGFIGVGSYSSSKKMHQKIYDSWRSMFTRCYCPEYKKRKPTYKDCSVHPDWYDFQNFAKWYEENKPSINGVIHLDKDIKIKGNKIYSRETCLLVPAKENISFTSSKDWVFISPKGEVNKFTSLRSFCINNGLTESSMRMVNKGTRKHHKGWTKYV